MARSVTMKKIRQNRESERQVVVRYFVCRCGRVRIGITV
jgi:CDGSH-type Zn-finger protein